jgi:hypothetical protein
MSSEGPSTTGTLKSLISACRSSQRTSAATLVASS